MGFSQNNWLKLSYHFNASVQLPRSHHRPRGWLTHLVVNSPRLEHHSTQSPGLWRHLCHRQNQPLDSCRYGGFESRVELHRGPAVITFWLSATGHPALWSDFSCSSWGCDSSFNNSACNIYTPNKAEVARKYSTSLITLTMPSPIPVKQTL